MPSPLLQTATTARCAHASPSSVCLTPTLHNHLVGSRGHFGVFAVGSVSPNVPADAVTKIISDMGTEVTKAVTQLPQGGGPGAIPTLFWDTDQQAKALEGNLRLLSPFYLYSPSQLLVLTSVAHLLPRRLLGPPGRVGIEVTTVTTASGSQSKEMIVLDD